MSLKNLIFKNIHKNNLIYNACWEDPRCDRELLDVDADSEIVMITSAGCNALDYLLDNPKNIHCIDMNPRQNALLELKLSVFRNAGFDELYQLFGRGVCRDAETIYRHKLRSDMPEFAQKYWDKNMNFFEGGKIRKTFYYHGATGVMAWALSSYLKAQKELYKNIQRLLNAESFDIQRELYYQLEPLLLKGSVQWFMNRPIAMYMLGVPDSQISLFKNSESGASGFIRQCMRNVFTQLPVKDNYFWKVYLEGSYSPDCCPNYLKEENFNIIRNRVNRVKTYNTTVSDFLIKEPNSYSHYVLLDHQDWLAANEKLALEEEWRHILKNSKKGTKTLLRSASAEINFFPDFVEKSITFEKDRTNCQHQKDRVGTYASVYLGVVK